MAIVDGLVGVPPSSSPWSENPLRALAADFAARLVATWRHEYSSKVQQRRCYSALSSGAHPHSARLSDAEREPCRHFASKGLRVRVPLAPPISPCQANLRH